MRPTDTLAKEHALVLRVTKAAEQEVRYIHDTGEYRAEEVGEVVDFFEFFAEACHDPKEERYLFARLQQRGLPADSGILAQFIREHRELTARLRDVEHWLRRDKKEGPLPPAELAELLKDYLDLMRSHVMREEDLLFTLANGLLTDEDQEALEEAFGSEDAAEAAEGVHDRYSDLAHLLVGRPTETLQKEHKVCYDVLDAAEREVAAMRRGDDTDLEKLDELVDFLHFYTRECHEPKEAQLLYSKLAQRGVSMDDGVMAEMSGDHESLSTRFESIERHLEKARASGTKPAAAFYNELEEYIAAMRRHMDVEEQTVFPMVNHVLTQRDLEELEQAYTSMESQDIIAGVHEKYVDIARHLSVSK
jgi:hemerythrin-like domain-containing protein